MPFGDKERYEQYDDVDIHQVTLSRLILRHDCDLIAYLPLINLLSDEPSCSTTCTSDDEENEVFQTAKEVQLQLLSLHRVYFFRNKQGLAFAYIPPVRDQNSPDHTVIPPRLKDAILYYNRLISVLQQPDITIEQLKVQIQQKWPEKDDEEIQPFLNTVQTLLQSVDFAPQSVDPLVATNTDVSCTEDTSAPSHASMEPCLPNKAPLVQLLLQHMETGVVQKALDWLKKLTGWQCHYSFSHFTVIQLRHNLDYARLPNQPRYLQLVYNDSRSEIKLLWARSAKTIQAFGEEIGGIALVDTRYLGRQSMLNDLHSCGAWCVRITCTSAVDMDSILEAVELNINYNVIDGIYDGLCNYNNPHAMMVDRKKLQQCARKKYLELYPNLPDEDQKQAQAVSEQGRSCTSQTSESDEESPNEVDKSITDFYFVPSPPRSPR